MVFETIKTTWNSMCKRLYPKHLSHFDLQKRIRQECWRHYRNRWRQVKSMWNTNHLFYINAGVSVYNLDKIIQSDSRGRMQLDRSFYYQWKRAAQVLEQTKDGPSLVYLVLDGTAFEEVFGKKQLSPLQKLGAYVIWQGLQDENVRKEIGNLVEANVQQPNTELGGFIRLSQRKSILGISLLERPNLSPGHSFGFSLKELKYSENFACFHLHSIQEDCSSYYGPSGFDDNPSSRASDVTLAIDYAEEATEFRGAVFTKLSGKRFAAHYFCTDSTPPNEAQTILGTRKIGYCNSVVLGKFNYS